MIFLCTAKNNKLIPSGLKIHKTRKCAMRLGMLRSLSTSRRANGTWLPLLTKQVIGIFILIPRIHDHDPNFAWAWLTIACPRPAIRVTIHDLGHDSWFGDTSHDHDDAWPRSEAHHPGSRFIYLFNKSTTKPQVKMSSRPTWKRPTPSAAHAITSSLEHALVLKTMGKAMMAKALWRSSRWWRILVRSLTTSRPQTPSTTRTPSHVCSSSAIHW